MESEHSLKEESEVNDCFRRLPLEIRFEIAYLLSTPEYLSLRLASKAMVPLFEAQQFWKTRFLIHRERGYLNYLLEESHEDWRLMYRCTSRLKRLTKKIRFRRLQWLHNEWIKDRCMMVGAPIPTSPGSNTGFDGLLWDRAAGKVQCDRPYRYLTPASLDNDTCNRCRGVHKLLPPQMITTSSGLVEIAVSVLAEDEHSFITGFKFVYSESSPSVNFGYQIPQKQIKIDLRSQLLTGFEVFAGEGGIQAVRPIFDQKYGICHSLIGKPNATCKSVLLTPDGEIRAFIGEFDVSQILMCCSNSHAQVTDSIIALQDGKPWGGFIASSVMKQAGRCRGWLRQEFRVGSGGYERSLLLFLCFLVLSSPYLVLTFLI
jgi:hypothetical protein